MLTVKLASTSSSRPSFDGSTIFESRLGAACVTWRLTSREMDCLVLTLRGFSAKEAARQLQLSNRTVEKHIENLKIKIGCSRKTELLARISVMMFAESSV